MAVLGAMWIALGPACTGNPTPDDGTSIKPPEVDAEACAELRGHVTGLYRVQRAQMPAAGDGSDRTADDTGADDSRPPSMGDDSEGIADDTEMALADCRRQPQRVVPCLRGAQSAAELEQRCLIALDDEGTIEGAQFGAGAAAGRIAQ
ncbi:MAG: hypothetical protein AAGC55_26465 [Myxococcota bacterium]